MKTIRSHVFETNSSSCHALAVFHADEWEQLTIGDAYIRDPYSLSGKILSLAEAKEEIINCMEDNKDAETAELLEPLYEKLRGDDELFRNLMAEPERDGELLGSSLEGVFQDAWSDSNIMSYEAAYGSEAEIWPIDDEDSFIFEKEDLVIINGEYSC